jgi:RNA polymerase sigma-70 factor (ECF subfamily)
LNSLTDNALMLKVKEGDLNRMGLLFERYHRELFGFLYHMSGNPDASEDMVQTVFYRMLKYRHTFTGEGSFRTWMYHLARNVLADSVQQNKRSAQQYDVQAYADRIGGGTMADESLQKEQELALLQEALSRLSADHREVLVMSRYQELKYEEIARLLNTTEGAVKVRVHRAMNELKKIYLNSEHER